MSSYARPVRVARTAAVTLHLIVGATASVGAQAPQRFPLVAIGALRPHNVTAEPVTLSGKRGVRLTVADSARRERSGARAGQHVPRISPYGVTFTSTSIPKKRVAYRFCRYVIADCDCAQPPSSPMRHSVPASCTSVSPLPVAAVHDLANCVP